MWSLERTEQCAHCPWKISTNPHDIPNGYNPERHRKLENTIAKGDILSNFVETLKSGELRIMACHEEHETPCIGWLANQLGPGNNIALRLKMRSCTNASLVELHGPQHKCFEDTLP